MTSADKVLCPWCGAEMSACYSRGKVLGEWKDYYDAHLRCTGCGAQGPFARWNTPEGAKEAARAATLQRYTPPIRQMTLEEVIAFDGEIWMEDKSDFVVWACRCFFNHAEKKMTVHYITMNTVVLEFSTYGKTWRCWERVPTDEERSAAEWRK